MKMRKIFQLLVLLLMVLPVQVLLSSILLGAMADDSALAQRYNDDYDENDEEGPGVIVYRHARFKGNRLFIPAGEGIRDLRAEDFNDEISSIEVVGGATAIIYEHKNFNGESARVNRSVADMVRFDGGFGGGNWNDRVSSIKVFGGHGHGHGDDYEEDESVACVFYEESRRHSPSFKAMMGKHGRIERSWNDRVQVVWLRRGYILTLYEHADFRGEEVVLEGRSRRGGEFYNLDDYNFSRRASSYILEKRRRY